ncbi:hypothetical protein TNCV_1872331 [Trichonephila clavipes]|nr:hypothetical protein TNCV_1872331 [Trichonephila clavipes]
MSVQRFLKLEGRLELLNSLDSDEIDAEIAVLPPDTSELTKIRGCECVYSPNYWRQSILEFVQSPKNIIDADSDDENEMDDEMDNPANAPTLYEMRNFMKNRYIYLDAHSNDMNNKTNEIEQFVAKKGNAKEKSQIIFQELNKCFAFQKNLKILY